MLLTVTTAGLTTFGVLSVLLLDRAQLQRVDDQLGLLAQDLTSHNRPPPPPTAEPGADERLPSDVRLLFFDPRGEPLARLGDPSGDSTMPRLPPMDAAAVGARGSEPMTVADVHTDVEWRLRTVVQPPIAAQPDGGTLAIALSLETAEATTAELRTIELVAGAVLLLALSGVAFWLVRLSLVPLTRIENTAEAITAGDLDRRVEETDAHTEAGRRVQRHAHASRHCDAPTRTVGTTHA
jgi:two-component system OmpR family sensor kinase